MNRHCVWVVEKLAGEWRPMDLAFTRAAARRSRRLLDKRLTAKLRATPYVSARTFDELVR